MGSHHNTAIINWGGCISFSSSLSSTPLYVGSESGDVSNSEFCGRGVIANKKKDFFL